jgi:rSAM/selenodomain-associated transferase 2
MREDVAALELTIIVPTFNEESTLPTLLSCLAAQQGVDFELIVADGGSIDGTREILANATASFGFPLTLLQCRPGRGAQLNAGARLARGETLLFLHADSAFPDHHALADGLFFLNEEIARRGSAALAGHFALRFSDTGPKHPAGYAYYESKARLDRPGCIHGDQGFMLRRAFFRQVGPFDASLPFLEDERFAGTLSGQGQWVLLPAEILTSARRFVTEGLFRRQLLNALVLNALAIGWDDFLREAPGLYALQDQAGPIDLRPFLRHIKKMLNEMSRTEARRTWYRSAAYARDNGWQLLLALDVWRGRRGDPAFRGERTPLLDRWERWYDRLTDHAGGRLLVAAGLWSVFHLALLGLGGGKKIRSASAA